jgi:hypothetical protein
MKKLILILIMCIPLLSPAIGNKKAERYVAQLQQQLEEGRLAERTNFALDILLSVAYNKLKNEGHNELADKIKTDWKGTWNGYLMQVRDIGDHEPLSEWLAQAYKDIEAALGKGVCEFFHLDDINIINYALPVVFKCSIAFDKIDYSQHFVPLTGVVSYWVSAGFCILASSGLMSFFCSPIGMLAEHLMITFIAPPISNKIYEAFCTNDVYYVEHVKNPMWDF